MRSSLFASRATVHPPPPLTPLQRQYLNGWIRMLDVDLELAQATLRLGDRRLPCPPIDLPAVMVDGVVLAPAVEAPAPDAPPEPAPIAATALRGAYARRAQAGKR